MTCIDEHIAAIIIVFIASRGYDRVSSFAL